MSAHREVRRVVGGQTRPRDWGRIRLSPGTLRRIVLLAVVPLMGTAIWIVFRGSEVDNALSDAFLGAYLIGTPMLVGLHWWRRRPGNPIGMLLIALGLCFWLVFLRGTDAPLLRNVGVLAEGPLLFLIAYLTLVFPTGRLAGSGERAIASLAAVAAVLTVVTALFSLDIRAGGLDSRCLTGCPLNVVTVGPISEPSASLATAGEAAVAVVALGVMILLGLRLVTGSRPERLTLVPVAIASFVVFPPLVAINAAALSVSADADRFASLGFLVVHGLFLYPLGFLLGIVTADLYASTALRELLGELVAGDPSRERWRNAVADVLDDPAVRVAYWDSQEQTYVTPQGDRVDSDPQGQVAMQIERDGDPLALIVADANTEPGSLRDAAHATEIAVDREDREVELRTLRGRVVQAGDDERRRIQRDFHDSAQQRLVALRVHLALAQEQLHEHPDQQAIVRQLGLELDEALDELRSLAAGSYPAVLEREGVAAALRVVGGRMSLPVIVDDTTFGRQPDVIEQTVYFCCLEALQNAVKHAGSHASVWITLRAAPDEVSLEIEDDGLGFDAGVIAYGAGLTNMADRLGAVGGRVRVEAVTGSGTRITGWLPAR